MSYTDRMAQDEAARREVAARLSAAGISPYRVLYDGVTVMGYRWLSLTADGKRQYGKDDELVYEYRTWDVPRETLLGILRAINVLREIRGDRPIRRVR